TRTSPGSSWTPGATARTRPPRLTEATPTLLLTRPISARAGTANASAVVNVANTNRGRNLFSPARQPMAYHSHGFGDNHFALSHGGTRAFRRAGRGDR